ncbi:hypothetical protein KAFR_0D04770 [Kazachstania africana CBS 2517]|uniref:DNA repair protein n=1 Tax=Kazachstania africana (strain ATCC 22294 / BCRC 22015 / CBS 2517 / CECT 1963 / NBRC 1671 / NRRL Y-8276) TaxID=1071382 RepID=H2AUS4_KAZAF|nr:hypothetical protein KAFR_0D04770 [Kazachstania africana CBS 2517]CCF58124.1 hypothetical protein KAFR_0D04770 [Kazachstania africana CBS 2517]
MDKQIEKRNEQVQELRNKCKELEKEFEILCQQNGSTHTPGELKVLHIRRLKEYNELRDTGLRLVQIIAGEKQCKLKEVFDEMGFDMEDR